jgi:hypothetical protein
LVKTGEKCADTDNIIGVGNATCGASTHCDIVEASGIAKGAITDGGVIAAGGVVQERLGTDSGVGAARAVAGKRIQPDRRIAVPVVL